MELFVLGAKEGLCFFLDLKGGGGGGVNFLSCHTGKYFLINVI